ETPMLRKTNRLPRKVKRDKFQFELLEPRQMLSASGGLTLEELLALRQNVLVEHQVETPDTTDTAPPLSGQADQPLDPLQDFYYRPIVTMPANASVNAFASLQLNAE